MLEDEICLEQDQSYSRELMCWSVAVCFLTLVLANAIKSKLNTLAKETPIEYHDKTLNIIICLLAKYIDWLHGAEAVGMHLPEENSVFAIGPHLTGPLDGACAALSIARHKDRTPPAFLYTVHFNQFPLIAKIAESLQLIPVASRPLEFKTADEHTSKNTAKLENRSSPTLDAAVTALQSGRNVMVFPEGQALRRGYPLPRIHSGVIHMALKSHKPLCVIELSGARSLDIFFIPAIIRDTTLYQVFLTFLLPNDMKIRHLKTFDTHLRKEFSVDESNQYIKEITDYLYENFHSNIIVDENSIVRGFFGNSRLKTSEPICSAKNRLAY